jgi:DTW domain-containing protein YfiP
MSEAGSTYGRELSPFHTMDERLLGRCPRCWVRQAHCLCDVLPCLETRTELVVVRHEGEVRRSTGTARIAALALPRLAIVAYGDQPQLADLELARLVGGAGTCLVYPGLPRSEWPATAPRKLVFLDGTWHQTRRMAKKLPSLAQFPRLWLSSKTEPVLRLRQSETPDGRSTLEAIADALRLVGEAAVADGLIAIHDTHVERVLRARGTWKEVERTRLGRRQPSPA